MANRNNCVAKLGDSPSGSIRVVTLEAIVRIMLIVRGVHAQCIPGMCLAISTWNEVWAVPVLLSNFSVKTFPNTVVTRVTVGRSFALAANGNALPKTYMDTRHLNFQY